MGKDFLNGDFSFKSWFKIMWSNSYIQLFLVGFSVTVYGLFRFNDCIQIIQDNFIDGTLGGIFTIIGFLIPPGMCVVIGYKGFYQFWNDLKQGKSR